MKRFLFLFLLWLASCTVSYAQQGILSGKVTEMESNAPVAGATVRIISLGVSAITDPSGFFEIRNLPYGNYILSVSGENYGSTEIPVEVNAESISIPPIQLTRSVKQEGISEISSVILDLEDENKDQNISGLLHASDDIFVSTAGYTFGSMFFRPRGYDSENSDVWMNGAFMNEAENGRVVWSNWGGLNDAVRNKDVYYVLNPTPLAFSNIGGLTNIVTSASQYRKQIKASYSYSNRMYHNRAMLTYSSGLMKGGWAVTVSGSRRWAQEGYIEGTFYDAWAYFLAAEKRLGEKHSLALTVFGAPTRRGQQAAAVQEAYDLTGSNYYNPHWGYQNGEKRNARVKQFHEPVFILNHFFNINDRTKLTTTASYIFGTDSWSSLTWYNAPDPRPDYYRYLPSYQTDTLVKEMVTWNWENNMNTRQINWDHLYQVNYLANTVNHQANYIVENNITQYNQFGLSSHVNKEMSSHVTVSGGLNFRWYRAEHYKVIKDLLGGKFWVDIDQYAQQDFPGDSSIIQNDLNNPNRVVYEGDKFGYDYVAHINNLNLWGQSEFSYNKLDFYMTGSLTGVQFWRTGYMKNGRHPDNSFGNSKKYNFLNAGIRGGVTYKITGRHYATLNGFYMTRAPFFTNSFVSPKVRDDVVPGIQNEKLYGGDVSYVVRYPWLKARLTYYCTQFLDASEIQSFYHDDLLTYVNFILTGVNKFHQGIEFGAEVKVIKSLSLFGVAAVGDYRYTSRPTATISADNGSIPDITTTAYLKNFYVPTTPQTALSGGLKFNYKFWYVDVSANYYDNSWLDFNPERRTEAAIANLGPGDPKIAEITQQQRLKGGFTLDASIGKSIRIKKVVFLNINASMTNVLNNQNIQSGGYEQNRFDFVNQDINKFPPKYYYYYGRTFFINISLRY